MHINNHPNLLLFWQRSCKLFLLLCWILGLLLGMISAAGAGDSFFLMMRGADNLTVSIPGLLLVTALPFLFTAFAVFFSQPWLLLLLAFMKAFSFGFCAFGIMAVYGTASWLVGFLLMFTDACTMPLLMWLWLRHCDLSGQRFSRDVVVCFAAALVLGIIDICLISPFSAMLL